MTGSVITIELQGGAHLTEFRSFWIKAVRAFDASRPGSAARCLRGPFVRTLGARTPPMNVPVPVTLPATAACLYVFGRSAHGVAHDVHLPLVPSPGESVVVPLTQATPEKRADIARARALLQTAPYVFASTAALTNPHWYTRRSDWADDAAFDFAVRTIRALGRREAYIPPGETTVAYHETVFDVCDLAGHFFVWSGWQPPEITGWINRKPRAGDAPGDLVDQTLMVHDAQRLEVPELPDGFAGLDPSITRCRFFQAGVHLFGYVAPNRKEC